MADEIITSTGRPTMKVYTDQPDHTWHIRAEKVHFEDGVAEVNPYVYNVVKGALIYDPQEKRYALEPFPAPEPAKPKARSRKKASK